MCGLQAGGTLSPRGVYEAVAENPSSVFEFDFCFKEVCKDIN